MRRLILVSLFLIGLLLVTSTPLTAALEVYDWSDDFSDGNYDGWTVLTGAFAVSGGQLTATELAPGPMLPYIDHPSNTSFGSWSFDVIIGGATPEHVIVNYMSDGRSVFDADHFFCFEYANSAFSLYNGMSELDSFATVKSWEHHIRIERTSEDPNQFTVYHNDTQALQVPAVVWTVDYYYLGFAATVGSSIDNINVVNETITTTTTTTTTTSTTSTTTTTTTSNTGGGLPTNTLLIALGGGIAIIVVLAIIVKMRS